MTNKTKKWIRAGLETVIHGGASAVASSFTAAAIDPKDWGLGSLNELKLIAGTFAINGGMRFFQWWQNNPLPPEDGTAQIDANGRSLVPTPTISLNPLSKVTTLTNPPTPDSGIIQGGQPATGKMG